MHIHKIFHIYHLMDFKFHTSWIYTAPAIGSVLLNTYFHICYYHMSRNITYEDIKLFAYFIRLVFQANYLGQIWIPPTTRYWRTGPIGTHHRHFQSCLHGNWGFTTTIYADYILESSKYVFRIFCLILLIHWYYKLYYCHQ